MRLRLTPGSSAAPGAGAPEVVESPEDSAMGPPLGCRCRLAACALGSREILKRESRQSADRCVQVTILPIEHPEWNTRARVHPVRHARLRQGPEVPQRCRYLHPHDT